LQSPESLEGLGLASLEPLPRLEARSQGIDREGRFPQDLESKVDRPLQPREEQGGPAAEEGVSRGTALAVVRWLAVHPRVIPPGGCATQSRGAKVGSAGKACQDPRMDRLRGKIGLHRPPEVAKPRHPRLPRQRSCRHVDHLEIRVAVLQRQQDLSRAVGHEA